MSGRPVSMGTDLSFSGSTAGSPEEEAAGGGGGTVSDPDPVETIDSISRVLKKRLSDTK